MPLSLPLLFALPLPYSEAKQGRWLAGSLTGAAVLSAVRAALYYLPAIRRLVSGASGGQGKGSGASQKGEDCLRKRRAGERRLSLSISHRGPYVGPHCRRRLASELTTLYVGHTRMKLKTTNDESWGLAHGASRRSSTVGKDCLKRSAFSWYNRDCCGHEI